MISRFTLYRCAAFMTLIVMPLYFLFGQIKVGEALWFCAGQWMLIFLSLFGRKRS